MLIVDKIQFSSPRNYRESWILIKIQHGTFSVLWRWNSVGKTLKTEKHNDFNRSSQARGSNGNFSIVGWQQHPMLTPPLSLNPLLVDPDLYPGLVLKGRRRPLVPTPPLSLDPLLVDPDLCPGSIQFEIVEVPPEPRLLLLPGLNFHGLLLLSIHGKDVQKCDPSKRPKYTTTSLLNPAKVFNYNPGNGAVFSPPLGMDLRT